MKFEKITPKKLKSLHLGKKYNIETRKGEYLVGTFGVNLVENNHLYFFEGYFGIYDSEFIVNVAPYVEFSYTPVGNGFALTKNGSKIFKENIYGIIDDEQIAQHYVKNMNNNANSITSTIIKPKDIVEIVCDEFKGKQGIVTEIRIPANLEDHGMIEVFLFDEKHFEHFTFSNWTKNLKISD